MTRYCLIQDVVEGTSNQVLLFIRVSVFVDAKAAVQTLATSNCFFFADEPWKQCDLCTLPMKRHTVKGCKMGNFIYQFPTKEQWRNENVKFVNVTETILDICITYHCLVHLCSVYRSLFSSNDELTGSEDMFIRQVSSAYMYMSDRLLF